MRYSAIQPFFQLFILLDSYRSIPPITSKMKFFSVAAMAVLAAVAEARLAFTNSDFTITAGEPFTLTWDGASAPVTITLKNGPNGDLKDVMVLDSDDSGTSFTWTPPSSLPSDIYAFEIADGVDKPNYSLQFTFVGDGTASTSSPSETASPSTSASPSASTAASSTVESNSTTASHSSATGTPTKSSSQTASETDEPTSVPSNTNDGQMRKSPLALVLVTVAALLYFN